MLSCSSEYTAQAVNLSLTQLLAEPDIQEVLRLIDKNAIVELERGKELIAQLNHAVVASSGVLHSGLYNLYCPNPVTGCDVLLGLSRMPLVAPLTGMPLRSFVCLPMV